MNVHVVLLLVIARCAAPTMMPHTLFHYLGNEPHDDAVPQCIDRFKKACTVSLALLGPNAPCSAPPRAKTCSLPKVPRCAGLSKGGPSIVGTTPRRYHA